MNNAIHRSPSYLDIDALYKFKKGQLPSEFLESAGLPRTFVFELADSLAHDTPLVHSCFISYSTKDQEFADRLYRNLQASGVSCWFAPHNIQGGEKLHDQIYKAIWLYDRLLLILSEHSMNSEWVKTEIAEARDKECREGRRVLFPIRLVPFETIRDWKCFDADTGKDSARVIREYFIPDFSNWNDHDLYQQAFQRLLRDLQPETPSAGVRSR